VCSSPGPVIRMSPGKKYNLTLRNAGTAVTNVRPFSNSGAASTSIIVATTMCHGSPYLLLSA
jgi:hypothetical protein